MGVHLPYSWGTTWLKALKLGFAYSCSSFSGLPSFSWLWQFWRGQARYFVNKQTNNLNLHLSDVFSRISKGKMPFWSPHIRGTWCQHGVLLVMLTINQLVKVVSAKSPSLQSHYFPYPIPWKGVTKYALYFRESKLSSPFWRWKYQYIVFRIR